MKKISLIMAVIMLLSAVFVIPANALAKGVKETRIDDTYFQYSIIDNKYVKIVKGYDFIPEQIDGYPVAIIGEKAYQDYTFHWKKDPYPYELSKKWVIPDTVTYIEEKAFYNNPYVRKLIIPSSVTYIGEYAFGRCYNLKEITLPDSIALIDSYTFYGCTRLASVTLGTEVEEIKEHAFAHCKKLSKMNWGNELSHIGEYAFDDCAKLVEFDFSALNHFVTLDKNSITNKKAKIFAKPLNSTLKEYATENSIECLVAADSKSEIVDECAAGNQITLFIDRKKLTDYSTSNPEIIKLTKNGKLTALKKGSAAIKVTLPNGKLYKGLFTVTNNPVIKQKVTKDNETKYKKVESVSVKKGKTVSVKIFGKAKSIDNKYTSTSKAQIVSKKSAPKIKIKGIAKGTSTVKIKVNGVKTLKLKVKVT